MSALLDFVAFNELTNWSVAHLLQNHFNYNQDFRLVKIGSFLKRNKMQIDIDDSTIYTRVKIKLYNGGVLVRDTEIGKSIGTKKQFLIEKGQFLLSKIDARNGAFGVVSDEVDGAIITGNFWTFDVDYAQINPYFLALITTTAKFMLFCQNASSGTTGRHYMQEDKFLDMKIPLPTLEAQKNIVKNYQDKMILANAQQQRANELEKELQGYLYDALGLNQDGDVSSPDLLRFIRYQTLYVWSSKDLLDSSLFSSTKYKTLSFNKKGTLIEDIFRGKSPKYDDKSKSTILNQKCNRWNDLELEYTKTVDTEWFEKIDKKFFTQEGDILINSTGDGTIGRATRITKEFENLIYDSHILLLRVNKNEIDSLFLTYFINSDLGQKQIDNIKSAVATKQTELGINNLKNLQFVIPPLEDQNRIVQYIQSLKDELKILKQQSEQNRILALVEFEKEVFSEA